MIVLIGGPSGAGKSEIAKLLVEELGATYVQMDNFYNTHEEMKSKKLNNWDHPEAFNWGRFDKFLNQLDSHEILSIPNYVKEPGYIDGYTVTKRNDNIVIDGMYALTNNFRLNNGTVVKLYVDAKKEVRRARKIERDSKIGRTAEQVAQYFDEHTSVMEIDHVFPTKTGAYLINNNGQGVNGALIEALEVISQYQ